jgi:hypothetical protein
VQLERSRLECADTEVGRRCLIESLEEAVDKCWGTQLDTALAAGRVRRCLNSAKRYKERLADDMCEHKYREDGVGGRHIKN